MKQLDLSFGNPEFMWKHSTNTLFDSFDAVMYKDAESSEVLIDAIKKLHDKYDNTNNHDGYILITNGASQAISAAGYAFAKAKNINTNTIKLAPPYWGRIPSLLQAGIDFAKKTDYSEIIYKPHSDYDGAEFVTSPANPTCKNADVNPKADFTILDSCYNWPQYAPTRKQSADIEIYSMSKLSGFAGLRIGWALIKNKEIYESMKEYVYLNTIGVSAASQAVAVGIINELSFNDYWIRNSTHDLERRWDLLSSIIDKKISIKLSGEKRGMFLYLQMLGDDPLSQINTKGLNGLHFGDFTDKVRFNIGCNYDDFEEFVERLKEWVL